MRTETDSKGLFDSKPQVKVFRTMVTMFLDGKEYFYREQISDCGTTVKVLDYDLNLIATFFTDEEANIFIYSEEGNTNNG